ncbi:uncharacterized protein (TIGR00369 family) [Limimaricola variabilis]|uniref:Uncharacterized protein (TIGR00369 family) n=1 Tax=Limimaricola variabilis TaxID=1492771 RepID=A0ABR6HT99_9RHOB|nr:PaaI family thioesterase [Limimaricola variabilis]MBB3713785.1 uncharacterized protein (TIGR00369 family) [Limimaricola variabilis]
MAGPGIIEGETGAQRLIGYVLDVGQSDGRARCHLTVTADHTNRHGMLHGGIVATILDNAMGATGSLSRDPGGRYPFLTISLNTQYLAPAREGEALVAVGRITGGGRKILFIEGELRGGDDRLIATATGVFKPVPQQHGEGRA